MKGGRVMRKSFSREEDMLLKKIEDTRSKMIKVSTLFPLHSNEVVAISEKLDNLLNELDSLYDKTNR